MPLQVHVAFFYTKLYMYVYVCMYNFICVVLCCAFYQLRTPCNKLRLTA